ncbi:lamin tail domain-containing protein [Candidatus Parcubacteria bacterium]|nr:lamin tail domain-containing protein [Candidatus Parcubacteria bacterium]
MKEQRGFIMKLTLFVVAACVLFIVFASLARYIGPGTFNNLGDLSSNSNPSGFSADSKTNPLLDFLDTSGGSASFGAPSGVSNTPASSRSAYAGRISLSSGNASYSNQPFEEYVTIRNSGKGSVSITGWTLTNGKGTRPIETSQNSYIYPAADSATIGQGTEFLDPSGAFQVGPIVLRPGDNAIVTTGRPFSQFPFSIYTSFRENICEGYLKNYPFDPPLNQSCPYPANDPAIRTVTDECYDYMQSLSRCEDPEKYDKTRFELQTMQCRNFMTSRLNYPSCVARNGNSAGFSTNQWRVFLGKGRELWASQRETITLYDSKGLIVDQISY